MALHRPCRKPNDVPEAARAETRLGKGAMTDIDEWAWEYFKDGFATLRLGRVGVALDVNG